MNFQIGTTFEEVKKSIPIAGAWISIIGKSSLFNLLLYGSCHFYFYYFYLESSSDVGYIFIEKLMVSSTDKVNLIDMVMQCIAYYYNFNMQYPKEVSQSFDFIVRYFLNHYPEKPRGPKKNLNNMNKINNFIRKLNIEDGN